MKRFITAASAKTVARRRGEKDSGRREVIAAAALRVVVDGGLARLTHRAVADEAGVPLGSTTYYFEGRDELIAAAMQVAIAAERRLIARHVENPEGSLAQQLTALLVAQTATPRARAKVRAAFELYIVAARSSFLRPVSAKWDAVLREAIARRCSASAAKDIYALVSGLALAAAVGDVRVSADRTSRLLESIVAGAARR